MLWNEVNSTGKNAFNSHIASCRPVIIQFIWSSIFPTPHSIISSHVVNQPHSPITYSQPGSIHSSIISPQFTLQEHPNTLHEKYNQDLDNVPSPPIQTSCTFPAGTSTLAPIPNVSFVGLVSFGYVIVKLPRRMRCVVRPEWEWGG